MSEPEHIGNIIERIFCDHKLITWRPFSAFYPPSDGIYRHASYGFQAVCSKCGKCINNEDLLKEE